MKEEDPNWVMGFKLIENRKEATILIDHSLYINTVLRRFGMDDCNTTHTPLDSGNVLSVHDCPQTDEERSEMCTVPYRELIGTLTWIAVVSRPDISFAATYLMCFNANLGQTHWKAAKHVLRYLKGTANYRLTMGLHLNNPSELITYADSDWGLDTDTRCSVSGYVFLLGKSAISWSAKQQPTVAASSTEAEYMSVSHTARQGLWLRHLLIELGLTHLRSDPTIIYFDNRGAMELAKESHHHNQTKHIDIQHHFVHERVEDGTYKIVHCPTGQMLADILTKPLHFPTFSIHRDNLGLVTS